VLSRSSPSSVLSQHWKGSSLLFSTRPLLSRISHLSSELQHDFHRFRQPPFVRDAWFGVLVWLVRINLLWLVRLSLSWRT
jgi:hypothetical protein